LFRETWDWFRAPFREEVAGGHPPAPAGKAGRIGLVLLIFTGLVGVVYLLSQYPYFARLWSLDFEGGLVDYVINISAGPRLAYAWAGLRTFAEHAWTGVGLGASGFYLFDYLPDWSLTTIPEISRRLSPDSLIFQNTKNLYVQLLAETGLPGFWFFAAYYLAILGSVRGLFISKKSDLRFAGIAGLFIWLAVGLRNFTQDSLTFPLMWVGLGTVLGLAGGASREALHLADKTTHMNGE
jgi:O-antigen ligase